MRWDIGVAQSKCVWIPVWHKVNASGYRCSTNKVSFAVYKPELTNWRVLAFIFNTCWLLGKSRQNKNLKDGLQFRIFLLIFRKRLTFSVQCIHWPNGRDACWHPGGHDLKTPQYEKGELWRISTSDPAPSTALRHSYLTRYFLVCFNYLVSWCFEPSQPQKIISGLKTNFNLSSS